MADREPHVFVQEVREITKEIQCSHSSCRGVKHMIPKLDAVMVIVAIENDSYWAQLRRTKSQDALRVILGSGQFRFRYGTVYGLLEITRTVSKNRDPHVKADVQRAIRELCT